MCTQVTYLEDKIHEEPAVTEVSDTGDRSVSYLKAAVTLLSHPGVDSATLEKAEVTKVLDPFGTNKNLIEAAVTMVLQNNRHVSHTDAHAKHNLTGIIPINIRQEHKTVQEAYITTHTQKTKTRGHI